MFLSHLKLNYTPPTLSATVKKRTEMCVFIFYAY